MLGFNTIQIFSTSAGSMGQNSGMKFRHLYSNDLRHSAGSQGRRTGFSRRRSAWLTSRTAIVIALACSCTPIAAVLWPAVAPNIAPPKPASSFSAGVESDHASTDAAGEFHEQVGLTNDWPCEPLDVLTDPLSIEIDHWLVLGGVRTGKYTQLCSESRATWQITQTLEQGKWVMQKVARFP